MPAGTKVWRYMSCARFVWLLQQRKLWLSRADYLGDPWEIALAGDQLARVILGAPISHLGEPPREPVETRSERIVKSWRRMTFINCWSAQEHESHALWRIYCPTSEGVAIQTTLARLQGSVSDLPVYQVTYQIPGITPHTPNLEDLATKKRPMFAYEHEVRILHLIDPNHAEPVPVGFGLPWNPEKHVESIHVHPDSDDSFFASVSATVQTYSPLLWEKVKPSAMSEQPPF